MYKIIQLFKINGDYSNRIFGLDLLRFLAIFFVLHEHASRFFPREYLKYYNSIKYDGVGIFFVLSGFLIGRIFFNQLNKYKFNFNFLFDFWVRRWIRTLPNYFLFLIILLFFYKLYVPDFSIIDKFNYFIFLQNITSGDFNFFSSSWSLSVEEWFYISFPLLMLIFYNMIKSKKSIFILYSIVILSICNLFRYNNFISQSNFIHINHSIIARLDSIYWGVLAAYIYIYIYNNKLWRKSKFISLIFALLLLTIYKSGIIPNNYRILYNSTIVAITIFCLLPFFNSFKIKSTYIINFITYISLISYSIYLVNSPLSNLLVNSYYLNKLSFLLSNIFGIKSGLWTIMLLINFVLFLTLSILISTLIYKYYEVPMTKIRDLPYFKNKFKKNIL